MRRLCNALLIFALCFSGVPLAKGSDYASHLKVFLSMPKIKHGREEPIPITGTVTNGLPTAVRIVTGHRRESFPFVFRAWDTNGHILNLEPVPPFIRKRGAKGSPDERSNQSLDLKSGNNTFEFNLRAVFLATTKTELKPGRYRVDALFSVVEVDEQAKPSVKILTSNSLEFEVTP